MLAFILQIILMAAVGTLVFLFVRAIPRVADEERKDRRGVFEKWLVSELPERADLYLSNLLAKWLRKLRVFVMKTDNLLGAHLRKINPHSGKNGGGVVGFEEILEEKEGE